MESTTGTLVQTSTVRKEREDSNQPPARQDHRGGGSFTANRVDGTRIASSISSPTNEPGWDFKGFLEEQRRKEVQHDHRKNEAFQKVLSALGGNGDVSGAPELPPEIVRAWVTRNEKISAEAENAQKRQQKLKVPLTPPCLPQRPGLAGNRDGWFRL